jgi:hypothetical protein
MLTSTGGRVEKSPAQFLPRRPRNPGICHNNKKKKLFCKTPGLFKIPGKKPLNRNLKIISDCLLFTKLYIAKDMRFKVLRAMIVKILSLWM